jgi:ABC-2 type transport system ATP-binding protein
MRKRLCPWKRVLVQRPFFFESVSLCCKGESLSGIISIEGVTKSFGRINALDGIDLEIEKGELFGLLGPNGAGKTTLISILATILSPSSGSAHVCGWDARTNQGEVRRSIGVVFQDPSLDDELTGEENLDFHGRLYGLNAAVRRGAIEEVLRLVDLAPRRHDLVKTYSGGMRRRLEIARGLMHRPTVLFLDEPTLGLDPQTRRKIWEYVRELNQSFSMTIILTTHYMDEADQLCSRIAVMDKGRIVSLGAPDELKALLGGDLLELEASGPLDAYVDRLRELTQAQSISVDGCSVKLTVEGGESIIPLIFQAAHSLGVSISSVSLRKPNLEDVFIALTGREIRDDTTLDPKDRVRIYMQGRKR